VRRVGQAHPHLLRDRHEQVVEDFEQHRIRARTGRGAQRAGLLALEHELVVGRHFGLPADVDHRGCVRLGEDGRAMDLLAGCQRFAPEHGGVAKAVLRVDARGGLRDCGRARSGREHHLCRLRAAHRLDRQRLHHDRTSRHQKSEATAVGVFELRAHRLGACGRHDQRRVRAFVLQVRTAQHADALGWYALRQHLGASGVGQQLELAL
jgi:hypothetical protein